MDNTKKDAPKKPSRTEENPKPQEKPNKTFGNEPPIKEPLKPKHPDRYEVIGKKDSDSQPQ